LTGRARKKLRPHQTTALKDVERGFEISDRGRLIMACGTGKTFTSLKIAEHMVPPGGRVLFLAPSIALVNQTLREWTAESSLALHSLAVCSDEKVGQRRDDDANIIRSYS
jgi:predicted helicase